MLRPRYNIKLFIWPDMEVTLRTFRQEFHEKYTLIFAILKYLQSLKEQLKLLTFAAKHTESLVIHLCLAKLLGVLSFFFNSGKQNELNISEFSNSSVDSPQIFELLLCFWKLRCLGDSSWRRFWQKEMSASSYKNAWWLWLKRHWYRLAFLSKRPPYNLAWRHSRGGAAENESD